MCFASLLVSWATIFLLLSSSSTFQVEGNIVLLSSNDTFSDRLAAFGPRLPDDPKLVMWGQLIRAERIDEAQPSPHLCEPVHVGKDGVAPWVFLIERGKCSFIDKVRAAQASGASAVIIGDNEWNGLITMYAAGNTSDVLIPSAFVTQATYRELWSLEAESASSPLILAILPNHRDTWPLGDILLMTIVGPIILAGVLYGVYAARERRQKALERTPESIVQALETKIFFTNKRLEREPTECAICIDDFVDEDQLRVLPCHHQFHLECIDPWLLTRKRSCPICKQDVCPASEASPLLPPWAAAVL